MAAVSAMSDEVSYSSCCYIFLGPHCGGSYGPYIQVCRKCSVHLHYSLNAVLSSQTLLEVALVPDGAICRQEYLTQIMQFL